MELKVSQVPAGSSVVYIITSTDQLNQKLALNEGELSYINSCIEKDQKFVTLNRYSHFVWVWLLKEKATEWQTKEVCRKAGIELQALCAKYKLNEVYIDRIAGIESAALLMAEGAAMSNYQFLKYKSDAAKLKTSLNTICVTPDSASEAEVQKLNITIDAIYKVRTLVNEPLNFLTATQLAAEITAMGQESGFSVRVLNKSQIEAENMGGLLAVNRGSIDPPTFSIMEYKPANAVNEKPLLLVGKGIVYDTGGLSLKPTPNSMDRMKSDMSGAALVTGVMYAVAKQQLPIYMVALAPATDNRPGENAYVPGDVVTMMSGKTVEVLNTDAEGRMILGDALHYAKKYNPELVFDFATLTGAASVAVGEHGIVCMGNLDEATNARVKQCGFNQYERLVEYPMWEEYGEQIKSDLADIKNVGGASGGAITAGKFLEHFVDYPWMHFDIAGVSHSISRRTYFPIGGTAFGVRMVLNFVDSQIQHWQSK